MCWGKINFWGILDEVHKYSKDILNERETIFFFFNVFREATEWPFVEEICAYFCID